MWHVRRQLAFDIWPLALAVFLIACFERSKIVDADTGSWFTLFRIIFECTSAYSMIGLSMGTPNNNYSFCGEFSVPSKIVVSWPPIPVERVEKP
jgi:Trk-type K+ transport system membrane component